MHINEVESILKDAIDGKGKQYEVKRYCDHVCCESDFVLLYNGMEYAYVKFDEKGNMKKKQMNIHEEKMGTASFYIVIKDADEFIPTDLSCKVYPRNNMNFAFECTTENLLQKLCDYRSTPYTPLSLEKVAEFFEKTYSSLIRGRMQAFMSIIREETNLANVIEDYGTYFMLSPKYERLFFCSLLGSTSGTPKRVCRYTSLSSLFRMLSETRQSMCSTICMNDKTENDYSIKYLSNAVPLSMQVLTDAHSHSSNNVEEIKASALCGCFYCRKVFAPKEVKEFIDNGQTALCPYCGIDSVIGDASGYEVTETFLTDMYNKWFR